jgi:hypothetical protein
MSAGCTMAATPDKGCCPSLVETGGLVEAEGAGSVGSGELLSVILSSGAEGAGSVGSSGLLLVLLSHGAGSLGCESDISRIADKIRKDVEVEMMTDLD